MWMPGSVLETKIVALPMDWRFSWKDSLIPSMTATMVMIVVTPIRMPSMVRKERSLLDKMDLKPMKTTSQKTVNFSSIIPSLWR